MVKRPLHAVSLAFGLFVAGCQSLETAEELYASGDYQNAQPIYERLAQRDPHAQYRLGTLYEYGRGPDRQPAERRALVPTRG